MLNVKKKFTEWNLIIYIAIFIFSIIARYFIGFNYSINIHAILMGCLGIFLAPYQILSAIVFVVPYTSVMKGGIMTMILICIYVLKTIKGNKIKINFVGILFIVLIIWEFVHAVILPFNFNDFVKLAFVYIFLAYISCSSCSKNETKTIVYTFAIGVITFTFLLLLYEIDGYNLSIYDYFMNFHRIGMNDLSEDESVLYSSMFISTNFLALCSMMGIAGMLALIVHDNVKKLFGIILVVLLCISGMLTYSKSFFVTIILSLFFILVSLTSRKSIKRLATFIIILLLAVLVLNFIFPDYFEKYFDTIFNRFEEGGLSSRDVIFQEYIDYLFSHPLAMLFGVGLQSTNIKTGIYQNPHAMFIEVFASMGIVGLFLVTVLFILLIRSKTKQRIFSLRNLPTFVLIIMTQSSRLFKNTTSMALFFIVLSVISLYDNEKQLKYGDKR